MKKKTTAQFIEESTTIHNNKYDYSEVEYVTNNTPVKIICPVHGPFFQLPINHLRGNGCKQCGLENREKTWLEKYGVNNPAISEDCSKRKIQTNLIKYGVEYPIQNSKIKEQIKQTNLSRYNSVRYITSDQYIKTCIKQYGTTHPTKAQHVIEKIKQTNLAKYGVEWVGQSYFIKNKIKQTNLEKYGVINYSQQHLINILPLIEDYDWLFDQYINQNKTATQIADELEISDSTIGRYLYKHEIAIKYTYGFSYKCFQWLNSIMEQEGINIQHAFNGGEYQIPGTRYRADGYCQETNTIYEFHGDCFHGNPKLFASDEKCHPFDSEITAGELYQKTIEREQELRELGYNLIIMWESI